MNHKLFSSENKPFLIVLLALLVLQLASIPAWAKFFQAEDSVTIQGKNYTVSDLEKLSPAIHSKIKTEYAGILRENFAQFASKHALDLEAKAQNKSVEDILQEGFQPTPISDAEVKSIYEQYKSQLKGMPYAEAENLIRSTLVSRQEQEHAEMVRRSIIDKYKVSLNILEPPKPRLKVAEDGNPAMGPEASQAKVTIIEFSDFECPYCQRSQDVNRRLREKYKGQIRWVFRDYPLPFHQNAMFAHVAANCAIPQGKYWEYFNVLFENTGNLSRENVIFLADKAGLDKSKLNECLKDEKNITMEIQKDISVGQEFGVNGTPAFFINGIFVNGAMPFEHFDEIIQKEIKN